MTESPFNFVAEEPDGGDRRKLVLFAGVGALLVAVLGYFVVVPALAGGGDDTTITTVQRKTPGKSKTKTPAKSAKKKTTTTPKTFNDIAARKHPFRPLVADEVAAAPAGGTQGTAPGTTYTPPSGGDGSYTPPGGGSTVTTQRVSLMTVYSKDGAWYAQTKVNDVVYSPREGQVFASRFRLLDVSGKSATYQIGDEKFVLSVGQEVLK